MNTTSYGAYLNNSSTVSGTGKNYGIYVLGNDNYFSGNVGVGTSSPTEIFHVSSSGNPSSLIESTATGNVSTVRTIAGTTSGVMRTFGQAHATKPSLMEIGMIGGGGSVAFLSGGGSERMRLDPTGKVGIGTTSPSANLQVEGETKLNTVSGVALNFTEGPSNSRAMVTPIYAGNSVMNGSFYGEFGIRSSGNIIISSNNGTSISMKIQSDGNVGVGTTAPSEKLDVNGNINIASASALKFGGTSVCTSAGCTSSSDVRLKEKILPLQDSLEKVLSLNAYSYNYKDRSKFTEQRQIGVIAQEVEKVFPEVVKTDKRTGLKSVAYDHLVAPLIEAFKSLYVKVQSLDSRLDSKEQEIAQLREENAAIKAYLCAKDPAAPICRIAK